MVAREAIRESVPLGVWMFYNQHHLRAREGINVL